MSSALRACEDMACVEDEAESSVTSWAWAATGTPRANAAPTATMIEWRVFMGLSFDPGRPGGDRWLEEPGALAPDTSDCADATEWRYLASPELALLTMSPSTETEVEALVPEIERYLRTVEFFRSEG